MGLEDLPIIMTEKDAIKCKNFVGNFWYLKIEAQIPESLEGKIIEKLRS